MCKKFDKNVSESLFKSHLSAFVPIDFRAYCTTIDIYRKFSTSSGAQRFARNQKLQDALSDDDLLWFKSVVPIIGSNLLGNKSPNWASGSRHCALCLEQKVQFALHWTGATHTHTCDMIWTNQENTWDIENIRYLHARAWAPVTRHHTRGQAEYAQYYEWQLFRQNWKVAAQRESIGSHNVS